MFTPDAIAGNQDFTNVEFLAGQMPTLDVNTLTSETVGVNNLNLAGTLSDTQAYPGTTLHRVVAYAPNGFATTAVDAGVYLNKRPGLAPAANASVAQLFSLPVGAKLRSARLTNNGTIITSTGAATLSVAIQPWSVNPPSGATLFNKAVVGATSVSGVNNLEGVTVSSNVPILNTASFGTNGTATVSAGQITVASGTQNVGVLVSAFPLTAGDLAVVIEYTL
jgi:hypothetical protein